MKQTSRVFACWRHMFAILEGATWPGGLGDPTVIFGDFADVPVEAVVIIGVPTDRVQSRWVTFGAPSQDEEFILQIWVTTRVPGQTNLEALARLEEICDVVQAELRDQDTGRPAGNFNSAVPGVISHAVTAINPTTFPTTEGFCGFAEIDVTFNVRI